MAQEQDGGSYLAALKRGAGGAESAGTAQQQIHDSAMPDPGPGNVRPSGAEKRRSPRYKCEAGAELREEGADTRIWARCTDISLHGCYVEAASTYSAGTNLLLKIDAQNLRIQARGIVRVCYPHLGMGIAFEQMAEEDRIRLKEVLRTLGLPSVIMGTSVSGFGHFDPIPNISNPRAAVTALSEFFTARQLLTRAEFVQILHKSQTSTLAKH